MDSATMKGTVQGYFDRAFDEMTDKERSENQTLNVQRPTFNAEVNSHPHLKVES